MNDGRKKKPQKHQNKTGFKIVFDTLALQHQKKVSLNLLCKRCAQQISWKLQFNKYKKIAQPSKCNFCCNKIVVRSYMKACDPCSEKEGVCPKCLDKDKQLPQGDEIKLTAKQQAQKDKQEEKAMNDYVDSLKERSRRKVRREYEKGIITWDNEQKLFRDQEENQVVGLKFKRKGLDDLEKQMEEDGEDGEDQFSNSDDQDKGEQSNSQKQQKKKKNMNESQENNSENSQQQPLNEQGLDKNNEDDKEDSNNENKEQQDDDEDWQDEEEDECKQKQDQNQKIVKEQSKKKKCKHKCHC